MVTAGTLAQVVRGDLVESVHVGHLVVLGPDGEVRFAVGDPGRTIWPRSSLKPVQAVAMLHAGLEVDEAGLALACASHSGTAAHLAVVRGVLAGVGLTEADLQNTPDLPLDAAAALAWQQAGRTASSITQNCSGKHAAMLATCVAAGWDPATYRDPGHPLQQAIRVTVADLTGLPVDHVTVDGCGAPLLSTTVIGLARAFGRIAAAGGSHVGPGPATHEARVARAMTSRPELVGGPGRDVTAFMVAVPGLVAKDGAEGVYAAGLADGSAVAFKVADGGARPRPAVLAAALEIALRTAVDAGGHAAQVVDAVRAVGRTPVLGHGRPVGAVTAVLGDVGGVVGGAVTAVLGDVGGVR
ncbi:asparaginase [Cellulomonas sp. KRMCY2]|uniref:asparaginase n=1 Tax=Cellulomonas sp. KRMCY2 TaxID=1304865 RepID=UPI00045E7E2B|nr:asparaginase [Cellulomonas sp. KRMCY2]